MGVILILLLAGALAFHLVRSEAEFDRLSATLEQALQLLADVEETRRETRHLQDLTAQRLADLTSRMDRLEERMTGSAMVAGRVGDPETAMEQELAPESAPVSSAADDVHRYSFFEVDQPGVDVWQNENGDIQAVNEDPALTGTVITVRALDEYGNEQDILITLPAPDGQ